jgi:hypothetical protein
MKLVALITGMTLPLFAFGCGGTGNEPTGVAGQDLSLPGFPDGGAFPLPPLPTLPPGFRLPDGGFVFPQLPDPFPRLPDGGFLLPRLPDGGFVLPSFPTAFPLPPLPSGFPPLPPLPSGFPTPTLPTGFPPPPTLPTGFPLPRLPDGGFPFVP